MSNALVDEDRKKKKVASTNKRKITNYKHVMTVHWAHFHTNPETWMVDFCFILLGCWAFILQHMRIFTLTITYLMSINRPCHLQWITSHSSLIWMFGCPAKVDFFQEKKVSLKRRRNYIKDDVMIKIEFHRNQLQEAFHCFSSSFHHHHISRSRRFLNKYTHTIYYHHWKHNSIFVQLIGLLNVILCDNWPMKRVWGFKNEIAIHIKFVTHKTIKI